MTNKIPAVLLLCVDALTRRDVQQQWGIPDGLNTHQFYIIVSYWGSKYISETETHPSPADQLLEQRDGIERTLLPFSAEIISDMTLMDKDP